MKRLARVREITMKWLPRKGKIKLEKSQEVQDTGQQLREVRSKWPEIHRLVTGLATMNDENHYSQLIIEAMQGGGE